MKLKYCKCGKTIEINSSKEFLINSWGFRKPDEDEMTGVYCNMHVSMKSVFGSRENRLKDFADYMLSNHKKFNTILDDEYIEKINLIPEQANNKIAETIKIIIDSGGCNGLINIIL